MSIYRKRPIEIEARQLTRANALGVRDWCLNSELIVNSLTPNEFGLIIRTLEGNMKADEGDWVIRGVKGEFYPCKPDIFEATYEPVEFDPANTGGF